MADLPVKFEVPTKLCPMCGLTLVLESPEYSASELRDLFCQRPVYFADSKRTFSHYREERMSGRIIMYAPPYRVINTQGESRIGILSRYKTGDKKHYFKSITTCPTIPPVSEEKMANRIKMVLVFS
jgi:hypothetical protein